MGCWPALAIADPNSSLRLDGANLDAYYVEAAGQARFGRAAAAQATQLAAVGADSRDFVTWSLRGDLQRAARELRGRTRALLAGPRPCIQ